MSSAFETAASEARRLIAGLVGELKAYPAMRELVRIHAGLNGIEDLMQQPRTSLSELLGLGDLSASGSPLAQVKADDFVGLPALDAAKKYLKQASDARGFQEIVDAIKAGGGTIDNEDALRTGLSRSTVDILKVGGRYGLLEHYPSIRRGAKRRRPPGASEHSPATARDATRLDSEALADSEE